MLEQPTVRLTQIDMPAFAHPRPDVLRKVDLEKTFTQIWADLVILGANSGTNRRPHSSWVCSEFDHRKQRVSGDARDRAAPARVCRSDHARNPVLEQNWVAIGGFNRQRERIRADHRVRLEISRILEHFRGYAQDIARMNLLDQHCAFWHKLQRLERPFSILEHGLQVISDAQRQILAALGRKSVRACEVRRGQPHVQRVRQARESWQERRCCSRISPIFLAEWCAGAKNALTNPLKSAIVILHVGEVRNKPLADDALESQGDAMDNVKISPLAKRLAEENSIDWRLISGTGPEGRVIERDILNYLAKIMSGDADLPTIADVSEPDPGPGADFGALPGFDSISNLAGASASLAKEGVDLSSLLGSAPPVPPMPDFDAVPSFDPPAFMPPSFDPPVMPSVAESSSSMPSFEAEPFSAGPAVAASDEFDDAIFDLDLDALDEEKPVFAATLEPELVQAAPVFEPIHVEPIHVEPVQVDPIPEPVVQPQIPMPDMSEIAAPAFEAAPAVPAFEFTPEPVLEPVVEPVLEPEPVHVEPEPVHVEPIHVEPIHVEPIHVEPVHVEPEPVFDPEPVVPGFQPGYAAGALGAAAIAVAYSEPAPVAEPVIEAAPASIAEPDAEPAPWIATPAPTPAEMPAAVAATRDFFTLSVLRRTFNPAALKETLGSLTGAVDGSGVPANAFLARAASRAKLEGANQIALARLEEGQLVTLETPALEGSFREIVTGVTQAGHAASHADLLVMDAANSSDEIVVPVHGALLTLDGIDGEGATLTLAGKYSALAGSGFLERVAAALENPLHLMI